MEASYHRHDISDEMWALLELLIDEPDYEWLMIDASHIKVHPHAAGAKGGNQDMSRTKGGSIIHLAMDAHGMPIRMKVPERMVKRLST